jgi:HK97 family phage major capsid protein
MTMSESQVVDLAPITKALGDLNTKIDGEYVKKSDVAVLQKSLNDATHEIKVLKDRELDKPGMGMFANSREFYTTLAKAWRGDETAKKAMFEEYPAKLAVYLKAASGANEAIDSQGGIFVLPEYSADLLTTGPTLANIRQFMRAIPMSGNLYRIRALVDKNHQTNPYGGITVARGPEAGTIAPSKAEWEWIELKPSDITGAAYITNDLLEDATAFASLLPPLFMGAIEFQEQADFLFTGTGAGGPLAALATQNPSLITVAKEGSQTAATINITNVLKMRARCWGYQSAFWVSSVDNIPQFATMTIGQIPVFMPNAKDGDGFDRLLGRPILYSDHAATTGTLNDLALVNGQGYLIGDRGGLKQDQSIHVRFLNNETTLRFVKRNDGQPLWRAPLTPKNGNTRSPFVNLAARG